MAGGTGSRLKPLTQVTNKHLLPIYKKPMIFYPLEFLKKIGISEVAIVTGREFAGDFANLFGNGCEYGVDFTYKVQEGALGIAQAIGLVERIARNEPILVILGDNIFMLDDKEYEEIKELLDRFSTDPKGATIFLKEVPDPQRFGVVEFDKDGNVISIEEKPEVPKSNCISTGIYLYDHTVFDKIKTLKPSRRGELEVTDLNSCYLSEGGLKCYRVKGEWIDAGTFESLHRANILAKKVEDYRI